MEHEKGLIDLEKNHLDFDYFKPEYENQEVKKSVNFQKWYKTMKEKKGNKFKIVKCSKDGTYYSNKYFSCPVCADEYECKYCSSYINDKERCTCCIRRKLEIMHKCGLKFMDKTQRYEFSTFMEQSEAIKCFLIPYFSFVLFVGVMSNCLFYKIKVKRDEDESECLYILRRKSGCIFVTVVGINLGIAIMLAIPFIFYNLIFILISILLLPLDSCEICPYMYFVGFMIRDWLYFYKNIQFMY